MLKGYEFNKNKINFQINLIFETHGMYNYG